MRAIKLFILMVAVFGLCGFTLSKDYGVIKAKVIKKIKIPKWYHEGLYSEGKDVWVNNGKVGDTWVVDTDAGKIIRNIKPAGTFTEAITRYDKDTFFTTDWDAKKIYTSKIEGDKLLTLSEKSLDPARPAGVLWNGSNLFVITWTQSLSGTKFHLIKMDTGMNALSVTQMDKILEPCHMAWDGEYMWISCWYSMRIYKVDIDTLEILGYIRSPAEKTTGITWSGKYLWVTGTYDNLYKLELNN